MHVGSMVTGAIIFLAGMIAQAITGQKLSAEFSYILSEIHDKISR